MSQDHRKHLQTYLEAWTDDAFGDHDAPDLSSQSLNEELAAVEACLSTFAQAWRQADASDDSTRDMQFSEASGASSRDISRMDRVPTINDCVGRFRLQKKLGAGGMGVVFRAEDSVLHRSVAIKFPLHKRGCDQSAVERFQREAEAAARLRHGNIVGVLESGNEGGVEYIVSEFIDGPDLKQWLNQSKQLPGVEGAAECVEKLADGIQCAHDAGILHRDLKPGNILLQPKKPDDSCSQLNDFIPRITDFGLAHDVQSERDLTKTGEAIGTPSYCAPEQLVTKEDIAPPSDVFSLGTVLYQLLTGTSPFRRTSWIESVQAVLDHHPPPPRQLRRDVPRDLEAVCMKCLQKQPAKRYATAADLRDDLRRFREGRATVARPLPWWEGIHRWSLAAPYRAAFALVSVLLLTATVVALSIRSHELQEHQTQLTETLAKVDAERTRANRLLDEAVVLRKSAEDQAESSRRLAYDSDMRLAVNYLERRQLLSADDALERHSAAAERNLSWSLLRAILDSRIRTIGQHDGPANEVAIVPGTRQVVSVGDDGSVRHFDFDSASLITAVDSIPGAKHAVAVSPDAQTVAVVEPSGGINPSQIHLIDLATGQVERAALGTPSTVESLCWNHDGTTLAIGSRYSGIRLWNRLTNDVTSFAGDRRNRKLAFFPGPDELLIADHDALRSWSVSDPETSITRFAGPDGNLMFCVSQEHQIVAFRYPREPIIRVRSGSASWKETGRLEGVRGDIEAMAISPSGQFLATATDDGYVQTWPLRLTTDYETEPPGVAPVNTQLVHEGPSRSLKFVDDDWLVSCGEDGFVRGFNPHGSPLRSVSIPCEKILDAAMSPAGDQLFLLDADSSIRVCRTDSTGEKLKQVSVLEANTGRRRVEPAAGTDNSLPDVLNKHNSRDHQWISVAARASRIAFATASNRLVVFNLEQGVQLAECTAKFAADAEEWMAAIALSPDGRTVAAACTDLRLRVWSVDDSRLLLDRKYTNSVESVCISPDSKQIVIGGRFEQLEVLSLPDSELLWSRKAGDGTYCSAFSSDGSQFITGHGDGTVRLWNASGRSQIVAMQGHQTPLSILSLADHDETAVSIDERGDVNLWNFRTHRPIGRLFTQSESGVRFHRLLVPSHQGFAFAVISTRHGERLLKRIDLCPRR